MLINQSITFFIVDARSVSILASLIIDKDKTGMIKTNATVAGFV
jgi:hypothetical protein